MNEQRGELTTLRPDTSVSEKAIPVAFLDLAELHAPLKNQLDAVWNDALAHSAFIGGDAVERFEREWADYCDSAWCVGVANGTDAIELVLGGLGIGPGDEVIVPANTFIATAEAVVTAGATPVFIDVEPGSLLMTAELIEPAITARTRAIIAVHLYGQVAAMDSIGALASAAGIDLIEDAAQAHGASFDGRPAGSFGRAATFSFYPGKNLGALGDAGAVVSNDEQLADRIRLRANHGRGSHLLHLESGRNSRLDALQAAVLSVKLNQLDAWNARRRHIHRTYARHFADTPVRMLETIERSRPVHHLEVIRVEHRDRLRDRLATFGIQTGVHYAHPCHKHPAMSEFDLRPLPVAEAAAEHQMSLPNHPTMTAEAIQTVIDRVLESL